MSCMNAPEISEKVDDEGETHETEILCLKTDISYDGL